ncbi:MAG TPA: hypothetical protein VMZ33_01190, partial [Candidatus Limnocylindrales bacterium]|nr:hypothetical protein [Candidatus Limnocylindrales bacterium]
FSGVGVYGESSTVGFTLDVGTAATYGISGSALGMSPEGEELLTHVPSDWQNQCIQAPAIENEVAAIVCFLQQDGAGVELASYESFGTNEEMDAAYQERVTNFGVAATGSCQDGPNETTWSMEGEGTLGRVQCAPQLAGIRADWTDDRLGILSSLIDFEGNYGLMYETWKNAGPNP